MATLSSGPQRVWKGGLELQLTGTFLVAPRDPAACSKIVDFALRVVKIGLWAKALGPGPGTGPWAKALGPGLGPRPRPWAKALGHGPGRRSENIKIQNCFAP